MTDIPNSRRSPMEHERDMPTLQERLRNADIFNPTDEDLQDEAADALDAAQNRAYWLAIAICGGEDAPGYVESVPLATLTDMLRKERRWRDDALDAALAEIDRLRKRVEAADEMAEMVEGYFHDYDRTGPGDLTAAREAYRATATT